MAGILIYVIAQLSVSAESDPFALVQGLPIHPLVVHAAVVFIPLAALGVLLMAVWPKFGARFGWIVWALALFATGAAFVAKESGEALEEIIGEPGFDHAELGDKMPFFTGVLFLVALILWLVQRSCVKRENAGKAGLVVVGLIAAAVALFNLYWVYTVGDSGAKSVWKGEIAAATAPRPAETPTATPTQSPSASASDDGTFTAAEVATHNTAGDCWTSINGNVYDLTDWEDKHPGGAERIIALCGTDGSSAFDDQHSGEPEPEDMLAEYKIGVLAQ